MIHSNPDILIYSRGREERRQDPQPEGERARHLQVTFICFAAGLVLLIPLPVPSSSRTSNLTASGIRGLRNCELGRKSGKRRRCIGSSSQAAEPGFSVVGGLGLVALPLLLVWVVNCLRRRSWTQVVIPANVKLVGRR
jgi:hypothetical protein